MVHIHREKTQKAKAHLELKLASAVQDNKKGFFKYINTKKRSKENIGLIFVEDGRLTNSDEAKAEVFKAFLPHSLIILIDLGLPGPLSWRTMTAGTVTFHLWTLTLDGTSSIS